MKRKTFALGLALLGLASALSPARGESAGYYEKLGKKALQALDYDGAIENYNKALQLAPHNFRAYNYLGYAYLKKNQLPEALLAFKTSIFYGPSYGLAYYNLSLAQWLGSPGDHYIALKTLKHSFDLDPTLLGKIQKDGQFAEIVASPLYKKYGALTFSQMPEYDTLGRKPYVAPLVVHWDRIARGAFIAGPCLYLNYEMAEDKNVPLLIGTDAFFVGGITALFIAQAEHKDADYTKPFSAIGGLGLITLMAYPAVSTVDGYLSGNNGKGERGLLGIAADGVLLFGTTVLLNPNRPYSSLQPEITDHSVQIAFVQKF